MVKNFLRFVKHEWKFLLTTIVICVFTILVVISVAMAIFNPGIQDQPLGMLCNGI